MGKVLVRQPFVYDSDRASDDSTIGDFGPSMTQQSQKEDADINTIVRRFGLTGTLPTNVRVPSYADFDGVLDYQTAMNAIIAANKSFEAMPADVRFRFQNDPAMFVDFCSDPANLDEMRKLGLAVPPPVPPADSSGVQGA